MFVPKAVTEILHFRTPHKFGCFSIDRAREFVDRQQNSIVPLSNEFSPEVIEKAIYLYAAIASIPLQRV
jgi:hypothetical protein